MCIGAGSRLRVFRPYPLLLLLDLGLLLLRAAAALPLVQARDRLAALDRLGLDPGVLAHLVVLGRRDERADVLRDGALGAELPGGQAGVVIVTTALHLALAATAVTGATVVAQRRRTLLVVLGAADIHLGFANGVVLVLLHLETFLPRRPCEPPRSCWCSRTEAL